MEALVSAEWLHSQLENSQLVILDASPKTNVSGLSSELEGQWIPGARTLDLKGQFSDKESWLPNTLLSEEAFTKAAQELGINQDSIIVVYDNLGIYTSPRVWWMFKTMGHQKISVLDGGLEAWINAGYETVDMQIMGYPQGDFVAQFQKEKVKTAQEVHQNISDKTYTVIDARSDGRFRGTAPEPRAGLRGGHIPGSKNIAFKTLLNENGTMKSKEELNEIFSALALKEEPLVFSCGSGLTACIVNLASNLIQDNDTAVYDGSWTEWAQLEEMPVEKE